MIRWLSKREKRRAPVWDTRDFRSKLAGGVLLAGMLCVSFIFFPTPVGEEAFKLARIFFLGATSVVAFVTLRAGRVTAARTAFGFMLVSHVAFVLLSQVAANDPDGWTYFVLGTSNRPDGLLYQVIIAVFAWALFSAIATRDRPRVFVRDVLVVVCIVFGLQSILVIMERFGYYAVVKALWAYKYFPVPSGTIGNSGMVAGLILPGLAIVTWQIASATRRRGWLLLLPVLVLYAVAISATSNKSSVFVALALAIIYFALRRTRRMAVVSVLTVASLVAASPLLPNRTETPQDLGQLGAIKGRIVIWHTALDAIRHIPVEPTLGWGSDAFRLAQDRGLVSPRDIVPLLIRRTPSWKPSYRLDHVDVVHKPGQPIRSTAFVYYVNEGGAKLVPYAFPTILDRAHDYFLDRALAYGVVDALVWMVLFCVPVIIGWRSKDPMFRGVAFALLSLVGYYLAWFPVPETEVFHVALIVIGWYFVGEHWRTARNSTAPARDSAKAEGPL